MAVAPLALDGSAVRITRAFRNWTQRELAQRAGLTLNRVWQIENNVCKPSGDELARIFGALSGEGREQA
jgi:transcriptional regulator with XRE-family HTH domain